MEFLACCICWRLSFHPFIHSFKCSAMENQTINTVESGSDLDNFFNLSFDASGLDSLRQLSIWARIISICAFIGFGFSLASAFFGHPRGSQYLDENSQVVSAQRTSGILTAII